jgi:hypothetical protein
MRSFVLLDADGAEHRAVDAPDGDSLGEAPAGKQWVEVPYPVRQWKAELTNGEYVVVPRVRPTSRELEVARSDKATQLLLARRAFEERPIAVGGAAFLGDEGSRTMLANALVLAREFEERTGQQFSTVWKLATAGVVTLNRTQLGDLALALGARVQAAFVREAQLRTALAAATTVQQVAEITWTDPT